MKCAQVCVPQTTYLYFTELYLEPDFPCLADEIAEPRPDMNINFAAFTVSEKSINNLSSPSLPLQLQLKLDNFNLIHKC